MVFENYDLLGKGTSTLATSTDSSFRVLSQFGESSRHVCEKSTWKNPYLSKWDWRFIGIAEEVKTWSKDPRKQVGCVLAQGKRDISKGYNGFPESLSDDISKLTDPFYKGKVIIHAEVNAILNAAKFGVPTSGSTAYVTYHPCAPCASQLIQAGVMKVVCPSPHLADSKWVRDFELASQIMYEAGVLVLYYELPK